MTKNNEEESLTESERNEWHYTNEDETKARKSRWTVTYGQPQGFLPGVWGISNDDLRHDGDRVWCNAIFYPKGGFSESNLTPSIRKVFEGVMADFLAWHAAQQQPEEPTGLGAVVEVGGGRYVRTNTEKSWWYRRFWGTGMSDIDYVREGFARGWQGDGSTVDMDEAFADNEREFDLWLAQHDAALLESMADLIDRWQLDPETFQADTPGNAQLKERHSARAEVAEGLRQRAKHVRKEVGNE